MCNRTVPCSLPDQYQATPATYANDAICGPTGTRDLSFQCESTTPTDRACTALTACLPNQQFERRTANYAQDRRCQDHTCELQPSAPNFFETPPGRTTDRVCNAMSPPRASSEYYPDSGRHHHERPRVRRAHHLQSLALLGRRADQSRTKVATSSCARSFTAAPTVFLAWT